MFKLLFKEIILNLLQGVKVGLTTFDSKRGNPQVYPTRPVFTPFTLKVAWCGKLLTLKVEIFAQYIFSRILRRD